MSLLAEGKRKVKYGLDPQNTQWSNDGNKFGQRLMEKMGWEKGKGLGANETGMTEHIKASYKWDQRGLGATAKSADAWVAHQDDFNDLLKMLNSGTQDEPPEEKDKTAQVKDGHKRYYGRFSRGRVQTLRTTEDLDCIFGRRKSASAPETPSNQSATNSGDEGSSQDRGQSSSTTEKSHGLTTVTSSTSVQEYFAKKMSEMKARRNRAEPVVGENSTGKKNEEGAAVDSPAPPVYGRVGFSYSDDEAGDVLKSDGHETAALPSRGWYKSWNLGLDGEGKEVASDCSKKSKKKKKKKNKRKPDSSDMDENSNSKAELDCVNLRTEEESVGIGASNSMEVKEATEQRLSKKTRKGKKYRESGKDSEIVKKRKVPSEAQLDNRDADEGEEKVEDEGNLQTSKVESPDSAETDKAVVGQGEPDRASKKKKKKRKGDKELEENAEKSSKRRKAVVENDEEDSVRPEETEEVVEGGSSKQKRKNKDRKRSELPSVGGHGGDDANMSIISRDRNVFAGHDELPQKKNEETPTEVDATVCNDKEKKAVKEPSVDESEFHLSRRRKLRRIETDQSEFTSMFPGSNLEAITGYALSQKQRTKKKVQNQTRKEKVRYRVMRGSDVNDKIREIAKCQRGLPKSKKESASNS